MPKGKRRNHTPVELPGLKIETVTGQKFIEIKAAAKLAGVHPVVLEVSQRLLRDPNQGARFTLGTKEMQAKATEIEDMFRVGLKKVSKAMGHRYAVRSHKDGDALVFWYATDGPGLHSKRKDQ